MIRGYLEADLQHKHVLVRSDLNISRKNGAIVDRTRLEEAADSLKILRDRGAKLLVLAHLGRPKGAIVPELSLRPIAEELATLLEDEVAFYPDPFSSDSKERIAAMRPGAVALLENLRFWPEEEANDAAFAARLATLGALYINDGFSISHRAHASTTGIADYLPAYAGPALLREVNALERVLEVPQRPVIGVIGGAKVSTKISVIAHLLPKLDYLVIGGGMANTFLQVAGYSVGRSLSEPGAGDIIADIHVAARTHDCRLILPQDLCVADRLNQPTRIATVALDACPDDGMILDIGEGSIRHVQNLLERCATVLWNGPLGAFEYPPFDRGTNEVAQHLAARTRNNGCLSIAGGGDTVAALRQAGVIDDFSHVSTAGGAFLEWLEGKTLPGIALLHA